MSLIVLSRLLNDDVLARLTSGDARAACETTAARLLDRGLNDVSPIRKFVQKLGSQFARLKTAMRDDPEQSAKIAGLFAAVREWLESSPPGQTLREFASANSKREEGVVLSRFLEGDQNTTAVDRLRRMRREVADFVMQNDDGWGGEFLSNIQESQKAEDRGGDASDEEEEGEDYRPSSDDETEMDDETDVTALQKELAEDREKEAAMHSSSSEDESEDDGLHDDE